MAQASRLQSRRIADCRSTANLFSSALFSEKLFPLQEYFDTASAKPTADHLPSIERDHDDNFPLAGTIYEGGRRPFHSWARKRQNSRICSWLCCDACARELTAPC